MKNVTWLGLVIFGLGIIAAVIAGVVSYRTGKDSNKTFAVIDGVLIVGLVLMAPMLVRMVGPTL